MTLVKHIQGLLPGPGAMLPVRGGHAARSRAGLRAGDEISCRYGSGELHVMLLGATGDGCLLGYVSRSGPQRPPAAVGELVVLGADRVMAILPPAATSLAT